jgi:hypothetical protein
MRTVVYDEFLQESDAPCTCDVLRRARREMRRPLHPLDPIEGCDHVLACP